MARRKFTKEDIMRNLNGDIKSSGKTTTIAAGVYWDRETDCSSLINKDIVKIKKEKITKNLLKSGETNP